MRYVMRIFDTPLLEFEASYGEGAAGRLRRNARLPHAVDSHKITRR